MNTRDQNGFSLIELMVTLSLLGLLALAVVPLAQLSTKRQQETELRTALHDIRQAIDQWKAARDSGLIHVSITESGYPPDLNALVIGSEDLNHPGRRKAFFLRRLPRDPFADPGLPAEQTWGLRSYASEADNPRPGTDIYDVYSLNTGTGLNGMPYREW